MSEGPAWLARLRTALRGTPQEQLAGARQALGLAFLAPTLPGLPLCLLYALTHPPLDSPQGLGYALLSLGLGGLSFWLAHRAALNLDIPREQRLLTAAIQGASGPAAAFLLGCLCVGTPLLWLALWALAALLYGGLWRQLAVWQTANPK